MPRDKFDMLKLEVSKRVVEESVLLALGAQLGIKDWEIKGIKYNKDRDGNFICFLASMSSSNLLV